MSACLHRIQPLVDACDNGQCTSLVNGQSVSHGGMIRNMLLNVSLKTYHSRLHGSSCITFLDATIMSYCHLCSGGGVNGMCCLFTYLSKSTDNVV